METTNADNRARHAAGSTFIRMLVGMIAAFALAFALSAEAALPAHADGVDAQDQAAWEQLEQAFIDAYEAAQAEDGITADEATSLRSGEHVVGGESIADNDTPLAAYSGEVGAEEEIPDDENPLAASPYAAPVHNFVWVLLAIIMAVACFFFASTRRLDKNINQMRRFVD